MKQLHRRDCLELTVAGLLVLVHGCGESPPETCAPSDLGPDFTRGTQPENVEVIATWIPSVDEALLVAELRGRLDGEWTIDSVFAALMLVGARSISSRYGGGCFHAVIQIAALRLFCQRAPPDDVLVPLVYGLQVTRGSLGCDPFELPAVDEAMVPPPDGASARLIEAVETDVLEAALLEVTALARSGDVGLLYDTLLELGSRRAHKLGHEAILAAKAVRLFVDLPGAWAEDILRAMIVAFMTREAPAGPEHTDVWLASRAKVMTIPCTWQSGADDPNVIRDIVVALRDLAEPADAVALVETYLTEGVSPRSIWDGIIVAACENAHGGGNYHAVTSVQALREGYLLASSAPTRLLMLLQGAAFVVLAEDGAQLPDVHLADLVPQPATLDEVFETFGPKTVEKAVGYLQTGGDADAYVQRMMEIANTRAVDEHHYKIPDAVLLEAERVPLEWRSHVLALARLWAPSSAFELNAAWQLVNAPA